MPTPTPRLLALVAALLALGVGIWFVVRRESGTAAPGAVETPSGVAAPVEASRTSTPPELAARPSDAGMGAPPPVADDHTQAGRAIVGRIYKFIRTVGAPGLRVRAVPVVADGSKEPSPWVETAKDGSFRIEDLHAGPYRLVMQAGPLAVEATLAENVEPGGEPFEQEWKLAPSPQPPGSAAPIVSPRRVKVVGPDGEPIPHASILLLSDTSFGGFVDLLKGVFVRDPFAETWATHYEVLGARGEDGAALPYGPAQLRAATAGSEGEVTMRLPREKVLEGRLQRPDGSGIGAIEIRAFPARLRWLGANVPTMHGTARTSADGAFRIGGLGDEEYLLEPVSLPSPLLPAGTWTARPLGTTVSLMTAQGVEVTLHVMDASHKGIEGALVAYSATPTTGRAPGMATTQPDGKAVLRSLNSEATYRLTVTPPFARKDLRMLTIDSWRPVSETLTLEPGLQIEGILRAADGTVSPGFVLRKQPAGNFVPVCGTMRDGSFTISGLPPGSVTLAASLQPGGPLGPEVTLEAGTKNAALVAGKDTK